MSRINPEQTIDEARSAVRERLKEIDRGIDALSPIIGRHRYEDDFEEWLREGKEILARAWNVDCNGD